MKVRKKSSPVNGSLIPASARTRKITYRTSTLKAMRSNTEVRRRKTIRRRGESWGTIVGAVLAMREPRKNNDNPKMNGARQRRIANECGSLGATERARSIAQTPRRLDGRAVVLLNPAVITAVREIDHPADGEPNDKAG